MVWRHARVASPRTPGLFLLFADPERCCCDPASSSREPDHFLPRDLQSRLRSPSVLGQTPSSGSVSPTEKTVRALSGWAAGANDVAAEGGPGGRLGRVHRSFPSRKEERSRPRKEERHVQRHRGTRRKTAASGPRNLWLQGTRRSSCFPGRQSLWPGCVAVLAWGYGSLKPSPTGRSPLPRRRRCTWSRSTPSPGSPTSGSRSWWCCPGRSTSMSGWPATVRGGGLAGPGGQPPVSRRTPRSWCSAPPPSATTRVSWKPRPGVTSPAGHSGSPQMRGLSAGPGRTWGQDTRARGAPWDRSMAARPAVLWWREGHGLWEGWRTHPRLPDRLRVRGMPHAGQGTSSPPESGRLCGRELVLPPALAVSPISW
ncbi:MOB kinase activator 2 isoform X1 [Monodon monoceros]|uniref:MOB kinase activator 2 isoform X1 n=1 Tax=Monodon monoceros TaxID=40151 RepID=UPI0010F56BF2|nr:MOB kinase activator 2 isoform X1 [Monodon monoceros]